jgi:hypothetical protein
MRKLLVPLGVIAVALAVASPALAGKYRTSPEEGLKFTTKHGKRFLGSQWPGYSLRGCWRVGPDGAGEHALYPGGVVCRFSGPVQKTAFDEDACRVFDFVAKQGKKKRFVTDNVTIGPGYWIGGEWCRFEPGAEEPSPPPGAIGPPLF